MSECYFHVKAVYGVTEDCFEIESRKSPSLFSGSSSSSSSSSSFVCLPSFKTRGNDTLWRSSK